MLIDHLIGIDEQPWILVKRGCKSPFDGVVADVVDETRQPSAVSNDVIEALPLPGGSRPSLPFVHLAGRVAFHASQDVGELGPFQGPEDGMNMVIQHYGAVDDTPLPVPVQHRVEHGVTVLRVKLNIPCGRECHEVGRTGHRDVG